MWELYQMYRIPQILSLDVVVGAIATAAMAAELLHPIMPWSWWAGLPLAVWIFYTGDHLLDAYRLGKQAHTPRHLFHARYFIPVFITWCIALITGSLIAFIYMPLDLIYAGLGIGMLGIIHLTLSMVLRDKISVWIQKETGVGLIYTLGIWIGPALLTSDPIPLTYFLTAIQYFFLALINLLIFSLFELEIDRRDGHTSFVQAIGPARTRRLISGFSILIIMISLGILNTYDTGLWIYSQIVTLLVLSLLWLIICFSGWFRKTERYRILGDAAFWLPGLIPLLAN